MQRSLCCFHSFVAAIVVVTAANHDVDLKRSLVWGPGLTNPDFVGPVRYLFVQLVDKSGKNFTKALKSNFVQFTVQAYSQDSESGYGGHARTQVIDRHDGSYILRYQTYRICTALDISISNSDGSPIGYSPYHITGVGGNYILPDRCNCPLSLAQWYKCAKCPSEGYSQIKFDVGQWLANSVNFSHVIKQVEDRFGTQPGAYSVCHYSIRRNRIFRKCYGEHVGFNMFSDAALLSLARKVHLPDTDFMMNLGDWPLENQLLDKNPIPILSWCGSEDTRDIVLPTYELMEAVLEMMGRQYLDVHTAEEMATPPWSEKINKAFFRGRDSSQERLDLVNMSRTHPDLLVADITRFFFFVDVMDKYGPEVERIAFTNFFKYKYQINMDGTVAAYRMPYLLGGNSLILKQDSPYYEHFYPDLLPWVHYVPFHKNISNIIDRIRWAMEHEKEVLEIIRNARQFLRSYLQPSDIFCYTVKALEAYSKILSKAAMTDNKYRSKYMTEVKQDAKQSVCDCSSSRSSDGQKDEL